MNKDTLPLYEYIHALREQSNEISDLGVLLQPFGVRVPSMPSDFLLIGHILDELKMVLGHDQPISPVDVLEAAYRMGDDEAERILQAI